MDKKTTETIVKVYAVFAWIGAFFSVVAAIMLLFFGSMMGSMGMMSGMMEGLVLGGMVGAFGVIVGVVALAMAVLYGFTGYGLWTGKNWARILAIIFSVLQLFSFPVGTIIGAFGIWFFGFHDRTKKMFK